MVQEPEREENKRQQNYESGDQPPAEAADEVSVLQKALEEARSEAEKNLAGWQRAQADLLNFKRRSEQEREETVNSANACLLLAILPVLDDFERAFAAIPDEHRQEPWLEGMEMIQQKLKTALEAQGLCQIEALGKPFDPQWQEAIMCCPGEKDIVMQEVKKGYTLNDRLLRPSSVIVGSGEDGNETGEAAREE
jgi:molecular chaperone GrpE